MPKRLEDIPNCWEVSCQSIEICHACPAYPDHGKECWKITGTRCAGGTLVAADYEEKILYCRNRCEFYRKYLRSFFH